MSNDRFDTTIFNMINQIIEYIRFDNRATKQAQVF